MDQIGADTEADVDIASINPNDIELSTLLFRNHRKKSKINSHFPIPIEWFSFEHEQR